MTKPRRRRVNYTLSEETRARLAELMVELELPASRVIDVAIRALANNRHKGEEKSLQGV